ncbi:MAG: DNA repair protein RecO [Patescibacteria group bacterium]
MRSTKVEGIILKYKNYDEASRLFTLFTKERGKIKAVAKGVRRITSKRSGSLDLMSHVRVSLVETRGLPLITEVALVDSFDALKGNLKDFSLSFSVLEILDKFFEEEDLNEEAFMLTLGLLRRAGRLTGLKRELSLAYFQFKLLALLGLDPITSFCVKCMKDIDGHSEKVVFNPSEGGVECPYCSGGVKGLSLLNGTLKLISAIKTTQFDNLAFAVISPGNVYELEEMIKVHIEASLNEKLVASKILVGLK